jgi:hypothetical protein
MSFSGSIVRCKKNERGVCMSKKKKYGNPLKQKAYEDQKRGERAKERGQIYTPTALVKEMLDKLPANSFDLGRTSLDPSCGNGQFLAEVYQRKLNNGITPLATLITTFGVEIDEKEAQKCRERLHDILMDTDVGKLHSLFIREILNATVRTANTLKSDLGNPNFWMAPLDTQMKEYYTMLYQAVTEEKQNPDVIPSAIDYDGQIAFRLLNAA